MASVTITIPNSEVDVTNVAIDFDPSPSGYISLGTSLSMDGATEIFLGELLIPRFTAGVLFAVETALSTTVSSSNAGPDFSDQMEASGTITIEASDGSSVIVTGIGDSTEPYRWLPSNLADIAVFANGVAALTDRSLTVTFNDNAAAAPDVPAAPTFTNIDSVRATVNWVEPDDNGADITSYDIQLRQGISGSYTTIAGQTGLTYSVSGLTPSTIYQVRVQATNSEGDSGYSDNGQFTTRAAHGINPGDTAFAFALPQPTVTHTGTDDHTVNAGDADYTFALPQPTVTHALAPPTIDSIASQTGEVARMLITAGMSNRLYSRRGDNVGSVSSDSDLEIESGSDVDRVQVNAGSNWVRIFLSSNASIFGTGEDGENADLYLATPYGSVSLTDVDSLTTTYGQWTTTSAQSDILAQIQVGDMVNVVLAGFDLTNDYAVDAGDTSWAFTLPQPAVSRARNRNAGDAAFTFAIPQPSVDHDRAHEISAGDVAFAFAVSQPSVTFTPDTSVAHSANAGDISWEFTASQPQVTHTLPDSHSVDAGDASWAFVLPQPSASLSGSHSIGVDDVAWTFQIPQPTVSRTRRRNAGDVTFEFAIPEPQVTQVLPEDHAVNAGDAAFTFVLPRPTRSLFMGNAVNAGDASWSFIVPQPRTGQTFAYTVDAGDVAWDFAIVPIGDSLLAAPRNVMVEEAGFEFLVIGFSPPDDRGQPILRFEYQLDGGVWVAFSALLSSVRIDGLQLATNYRVRLRAVNADGAGVASGSIIAMTATPAVPPIVRGVTAVIVGRRGTITWRPFDAD